MKNFATLFILLLNIAPAQAETSLHFSTPRMLKSLKDIATTLALSIRHKLVRLELEDDSLINRYQSKQLEDEKCLFDSRADDFPWEEFDRLERAFDEGRYLTHEEIIRFLKLKSMIKNHALVHPEQVISEPTKQAAPTGYTVPGMRMAGGCCSKVISQTPLETDSDTRDTRPPSNPFEIAINNFRSSSSGSAPSSSSSSSSSSSGSSSSGSAPVSLAPNSPLEIDSGDEIEPPIRLNPNRAMLEQQSASLQAALSRSAAISLISTPTTSTPNRIEALQFPSSEPSIQASSSHVSSSQVSSKPDPRLSVNTLSQEDSLLVVPNTPQITALQREIDETMAIVRDS